MTRLRSTVDQGDMDKRAWRSLGAPRCVGTRARRCSPTVVEEDEPDEAVLEGSSLEREWRRRGGATEAKNGGGLTSA
jgi:hypothetical protein